MRLEEITLATFTILNAIRILAYVPQIRKAAADQNGASAIAYSTWGLFFLAHLATVAYAIVNKEDMSLAIWFACNAACCLAIIFAALRSRKRSRPIESGSTRNTEHRTTSDQIRERQGPMRYATSKTV